MITYMLKDFIIILVILWFMPATPVLSNGGTKRGLTNFMFFK